jgi:hypothetical protein
MQGQNHMGKDYITCKDSQRNNVSKHPKEVDQQFYLQSLTIIFVGNN